MKEKLAKIESEIQNGLKLKAADRLRNLINENPNETILWNRLAELYYDSGFLDAAGRYWILTEPTDERIKKSVSIYEKSVNHSGYQILQEITFRGDKSKLTEYAQKKLTELETDSKKRANYIPEFKPKLNKRKKNSSHQKETFKDKFTGFLLFSVFLVIIPILVIIGLIKVVSWVF